MKTTLTHTEKELELNRSSGVIKGIIITSVFLLLSVLFMALVNVKAGLLFFSVFIFALIAIIVVYTVLNYTHAVIDKHRRIIRLKSALGGFTIKSEKEIEYNTILLDDHFSRGMTQYALFIDDKESNCIWSELSSKQKATILEWINS